MSTQEARFGTTVLIWTAFTIVTVALLAAGQFNFIVGVAFALAAVFGTAAVWGAKIEAGDNAETEKAKRRGRIEKFVDQLDDDEIAELRARLMADSDGETVSLDELLHEMESRRDNSRLPE